MAVNIEVESKPSGRVIVRVYYPDTDNPVIAEHLMDCTRKLHADAIADVARAWGIAYEPDAETSE